MRRPSCTARSPSTRRRQRLVERGVGRLAVGPQGVAAGRRARRRRDRTDPSGGVAHERHVGVPAGLARSVADVGRRWPRGRARSLVDHEHLGVVGHEPGTTGWARVRAAEPPSEGHLVDGLEVLVAEEHDLVPQPQRARISATVASSSGCAQVDAADLGADGAGEGANVEAGRRGASVVIGGSSRGLGRSAGAGRRQPRTGAGASGAPGPSARAATAAGSTSRPAWRSRGMTPSPNQYASSRWGWPERMTWSKPSVVVLGDALGDLVVAADQRGAGPAADESEAGPEVGRRRRGRRGARRAAPPCAAGRPTRCVGELLLRLGHQLGRHGVEQPVGLGPRVLGRPVAGDDVEPDAEAQSRARRPRPARGRRRTCSAAAAGGSPHISHVSAWRGGDPLAGVGRAAEEDRRPRVGRRRRPSRPSTSVVVALEVERRARPGAPHDREELGGAVVALVVVEPVAEAALLLGAAAGDDVEQQPAARQPLERGGLLGRQRRRDEPGPEGDEEPQPGRLPDQRRGREPGVLAPRAGRREHGVEADLLGGPGHLGQVVEVGRATARASGRSRRRRGCRRRSAGTSGRRAARRDLCGQSVRGDKADRFSHVSTGPTARAQPKSDQFRQVLAVRAPPAPRRRPPDHRAPPRSGRRATGRNHAGAPTSRPSAWNSVRVRVTSDDLVGGRRPRPAPRSRPG